MTTDDILAKLATQHVSPEIKMLDFITRSLISIEYGYSVVSNTS